MFPLYSGSTLTHMVYTSVKSNGLLNPLCISSLRKGTYILDRSKNKPSVKCLPYAVLFFETNSVTAETAKSSMNHKIVIVSTNSEFDILFNGQ